MLAENREHIDKITGGREALGKKNKRRRKKKNSPGSLLI